jgi:hypothetical protein
MTMTTIDQNEHHEVCQLEGAQLDLVTGGQSIWKGPGGPRSPQRTIGTPGAGDTIDTAVGFEPNNLPGGGPGSGPWGN